MIEINQDFADSVLHSRNPETNKNDYGRILCVCGSAGYTGAAYFSAQGAVRMGSPCVCGFFNPTRAIMALEKYVPKEGS